MNKEGWVYIVSNDLKTVLYIGMTNDIERRILEHKLGQGSIFTSKYQCTQLLYSECFQTITDAIGREKQLKNWPRQWKLNLIKSVNPYYEDLAADWWSDSEIKELKMQDGDAELNSA